MRPHPFKAVALAGVGLAAAGLAAAGLAGLGALPLPFPAVAQAAVDAPLLVEPAAPAPSGTGEPRERAVGAGAGEAGAPPAPLADQQLPGLVLGASDPAARIAPAAERRPGPARARAEDPAPEAPGRVPPRPAARAARGCVLPGAPVTGCRTARGQPALRAAVLRPGPARPRRFANRGWSGRAGYAATGPVDLMILGIGY